MNTTKLQAIIDLAWEERAKLDPVNSPDVRASVEQALMSAVPGLRATIQLLPMDVEAHFHDEKDLM